VSSVIKCARCRRRWRGQGDWNGTFSVGVMVGVLCPGCQTPEENTEAEVNQATMVYGKTSDGRFAAIPKGVGQ
jgi:hypothetical protein